MVIKSIQTFPMEVLDGYLKPFRDHLYENIFYDYYYAGQKPEGLYLSTQKKKK